MVIYRYSTIVFFGAFLSLQVSAEGIKFSTTSLIGAELCSLPTGGISIQDVNNRRSTPLMFNFTFLSEEDKLSIGFRESSNPNYLPFSFSEDISRYPDGHFDGNSYINIMPLLLYPNDTLVIGVSLLPVNVSNLDISVFGACYQGSSVLEYAECDALIIKNLISEVDADINGSGADYWRYDVITHYQFTLSESGIENFKELPDSWWLKSGGSAHWMYIDGDPSYGSSCKLFY